MRQVTGNMASVVKGMDKAMETMNLERISAVMDRFEGQFSDLDVQTNYMEGAMGSTTATTTPQDQVDLLISQVADEAGLELQQELGSGKVPTERVKTPAAAEKEDRQPVAVGEEDGSLADRLRALRVSYGSSWHQSGRRTDVCLLSLPLENVDRELHQML